MRKTARRRSKLRTRKRGGDNTQQAPLSDMQPSGTIANNNAIKNLLSQQINSQLKKIGSLIEKTQNVSKKDEFIKIEKRLQLQKKLINGKEITNNNLQVNINEEKMKLQEKMKELQTMLQQKHNTESRVTLHRPIGSIQFTKEQKQQSNANDTQRKKQQQNARKKEHENFMSNIAGYTYVNALNPIENRIRVLQKQKKIPFANEKYIDGEISDLVKLRGDLYRTHRTTLGNILNR
jgi:hypothetical protein